MLLNKIRAVQNTVRLLYFFWNRNIKEVKHWKRFLRPSGSIILRPLKNVWSVRILVYKSMRSIKARGLIQNVQYLLFRLI